MLEPIELKSLYNAILSVLPEKLNSLNKQGKINDLIILLGMDVDDGDAHKDKIAVLGQSSINSNEIYKVAIEVGIPKERLELCLEYKKAAAYNVEKLKNNKYTAILVGPMPHCGPGKGNYSSVISAMENTAGYPPVVRIGTNGMKITKSSFKRALRQVILCADAA